MSRWLLIAILAAGCMLPLAVDGQDSDVKAAVTFSIQPGQEIWAGQQVTLNLDLKTTGFSFSNTHFNLPEVDGAFLMQTDTTTIKFSDTINGQSWQIIRYPLALYPQKSGPLAIPSVAVRFITSVGFGSPEKAFEFQTEPFQLTVKLPPGAKDGELLITTSSFELDYDWQPKSETARTGDAFTLTVTRRAQDISAMLLPPIPVFQTPGLATYPQAPVVSDKTNRGDLAGERIDTIIWVVEKPGSYKIPGIRFQWWDPDSHELKQRISSGLNLEVLPSSTDPIAEFNNSKPVKSDWYYLLSLVFTAILATILFLRFRRKKPLHTADFEKSTFTTLQKACKSNHPTQAHAAIHAWLAVSTVAFSPNSRPLTLIEFAQNHNDPLLIVELERLQEAIISSDSNWQGADLSRALQDTRNHLSKQKAGQSKAHLAPLNP